MTLADVTAGDNCAVHAAVGRQEQTGRPYLFLNMWMTACLTALAPADSDALLDDVFAYLYAPDNIYEHHWIKGDLISWDNLAIQHARSAFGTAPRTLQRVTIAKFGYWEQVPSDLPGYRALQEM
jgi:taurine dioxygenase